MNIPSPGGRSTPIFRISYKVILLAGLALLVTACKINMPQSFTTASPPATPFLVTAAMTSLEGTQWLLQSYIDLKGNVVDVLPGTEITLTFQNGKMVGLAGCNNYYTDFQAQADRLAFSQVSLTNKYCTSPEGLMDQEIQYKQTLGTVKRYKIVDQRLQLLDIGGQTVLTYAALP
jgi:heat shock protein HslJ